MSSLKFDTALDDLFRQALAPIADQGVPSDAWGRLVRAVQMPPVQRTAWRTLLEHLVPSKRGHRAAWHRFNVLGPMLCGLLPTFTHPSDLLGI